MVFAESEESKKLPKLKAAVMEQFQIMETVIHCY